MESSTNSQQQPGINEANFTPGVGGNLAGGPSSYSQFYLDASESTLSILTPSIGAQQLQGAANAAVLGKQGTQ